MHLGARPGQVAWRGPRRRIDVLAGRLTTVHLARRAVSTRERDKAHEGLDRPGSLHGRRPVRGDRAGRVHPARRRPGLREGRRRRQERAGWLRRHGGRARATSRTQWSRPPRSAPASASSSSATTARPPPVRSPSRRLPAHRTLSLCRALRRALRQPVRLDLGICAGLRARGRPAARRNSSSPIAPAPGRMRSVPLPLENVRVARRRSHRRGPPASRRATRRVSTPRDSAAARRPGTPASRRTARPRPRGALEDEAVQPVEEGASRPGRSLHVRLARRGLTPLHACAPRRAVEKAGVPDHAVVGPHRARLDVPGAAHDLLGLGQAEGRAFVERLAQQRGLVDGGQVGQQDAARVAAPPPAAATTLCGSGMSSRTRSRSRLVDARGHVADLDPVRGVRAEGAGTLALARSAKSSRSS